MGSWRCRRHNPRPGWPSPERTSPNAKRSSPESGPASRTSTKGTDNRGGVLNAGNPFDLAFIFLLIYSFIMLTRPRDLDRLSFIIIYLLPLDRVGVSPTRAPLSLSSDGAHEIKRGRPELYGRNANCERSFFLLTGSHYLNRQNGRRNGPISMRTCGGESLSQRSFPTRAVGTSRAA